MQDAIGAQGKACGTIMRDAARVFHMSHRTAARYLARLVAAGLVTQSAGRYWVPERPGEP